METQTSFRSSHVLPQKAPPKAARETAQAGQRVHLRKTIILWEHRCLQSHGLGIQALLPQVAPTADEDGTCQHFRGLVDTDFVLSPDWQWALTTKRSLPVCPTSLGRDNYFHTWLTHLLMFRHPLYLFLPSVNKY